jgi:hypothetical protein
MFDLDPPSRSARVAVVLSLLGCIDVALLLFTLSERSGLGSLETWHSTVAEVTNWQSPSYNPQAGLMYVPALDWGGTYYEVSTQYHPGEPFSDGTFQYSTDASAQGAVRALNPVTGEVRWNIAMPRLTWADC